jgi:hypothetical protein
MLVDLTSAIFKMKKTILKYKLQSHMFNGAQNVGISIEKENSHLFFMIYDKLST